MADRQIPLRELLRQDRHYKAWFQKIPIIKVQAASPPWRLFIQKEQGGPWAKADLPSYPKAYEALRLRLPDCYDAAIHSKRQLFSPPILRQNGEKFRLPMPGGHRWCSLCRRPTIFRRFRRHPNLGIITNPEDARCTICGMRAEGMPNFRSSRAWPL